MAEIYDGMKERGTRACPTPLYEAFGGQNKPNNAAAPEQAGEEDTVVYSSELGWSLPKPR